MNFKRAALFALLAALPLACSPVRENREINFSDDGKSVGFKQDKGVYVAKKDGKGVKKIFTPSKETVAVSSPLFSPNGKKLIFTTAQALDGKGPTASRPLDPAGAIHYKGPVLYTCWLRGDKEGDKPEKLFQANCDHVGYVAANLAVRWRPSGDSILFLDNSDDKQHGVFEFGLASKAKKLVFPHRSSAVIFDWAPDKEHLVCVREGAGAKEGIWVGKPGAKDWWHVPGSHALAEGNLPSTIEQLRATRPAWHTDGRFAFTTLLSPKENGRPAKHLLSAGDLATRQVTKLAESGRPFRDLHWAKDGRLGVVQDERARIVEGGNIGPALPSRPVREFAGWGPDGKHIAYVSTAPEEAEGWRALLFLPDPKARDVVYLAPGSADSPGREVLSGLRVTFVRWSPSENKLSLWGTFTPSHRSWLGAALGAALRPGDPAAVFDPATGKLAWMPVTPAEMAQVGHYHLIKRNYAEAWRWYQRARANAAKPAAGAALPAVEDFSFFESYCLTKLGRHEQAKERLEQFRKKFTPSFANALRLAGGGLADKRLADALEQAASPASLSGQLLRALYQGEAFLSLGAVEDGEAFFRRELGSANNDEERLARAIVLAQLLLAQKKWKEYGRLTAEALLPLAQKRYNPKPLAASSNLDAETIQQLALMAAVGPTLLPLAEGEVLAGFDKEHLKACLPPLEKLADRSKDLLARWGSHVALYAVARKLGQDARRRKALDALSKIDNKFTAESFDRRAREAIQEARKAVSELMRLAGGW